MKFVIPGRLPGLNEMTEANRFNRFKGAKLKKSETQKCATCCLGLPKITDPVFVSISWFEPNAMRDLDNIAAGIKFILDGLVIAGILPNDNRKWILGITHKFPGIDPKNPRIEVVLGERADDQE